MGVPFTRMENIGERRSLGEKISSLLDVLSLYRYLGRDVPEAFGSVVWSSGERPRRDSNFQKLRMWMKPSGM